MRFDHAAELMVNSNAQQGGEPPPVTFAQANTLLLAAMGHVMPFGMWPPLPYLSGVICTNTAPRVNIWERLLLRFASMPTAIPALS